MSKILDNYFNIIRKFLPKKEEANAVGLDIGAGDCKLVEVKKTGDQFELLNWAIEPVKSGDIASAVEKIIENLQAPCVNPYTSVFGKGSLIRYISMPRMSIDDLKNSFDIEADKYFPFAQDQIYTDCFILNPQGKEKQMDVMAAAVKKEIIDQRMKLLNDLGFQVDFIGINPVALANALYVLGVDEEKDDQSAVALLDMGESVSSLTIMIDRMPRFTRDIFLGGHDFTKRISNAMGISFQEAEKLKIDPKDKLAKVSSACESAIINIVEELRLSFDYFTTEKNKEIKKLILTGGASILTGISEIFEKYLEVKVSKWDPFSKLVISPEIDEEQLNKKSLKLGVALGLALYHYD